MKILFRLYEPLAQKETLVQIVIHIILNKRHYIIPTEIHIIGRVWDREKQLVQGDNDLSKAFNRRILNLKAEILAYNKQCLVVKKAVELEEIKQLVFRKGPALLTLLEIVPVHLFKDELEKLEQSTLPFESLEMARDIFLFSCYTRLRFEDLDNFTPSNLIFVGKNWNIVYRATNETAVTIKLIPEALAIINSWSARQNTIVNNLLLPSIGLPELERCLREIGYLLGITKLLSQECALNTFLGIIMSKT